MLTEARSGPTAAASPTEPPARQPTAPDPSSRQSVGRALFATGLIALAAGFSLGALVEADLADLVRLVPRTDTLGLIETSAVAGMIDEFATLLLGIGWLLLHVGGSPLAGRVGSSPGRGLGALAGVVAAGASGIELWTTARVWGTFANPGPYAVAAEFAVAGALVLGAVGWYLEHRRPR